MSVTEKRPSRKQAEQIAELRERIEMFDARAAEIRDQLGGMAAREDQLRAAALDQGKPSWESVSRLRDEAVRLEAELQSVVADRDALALRIGPLETEASKLEADALVAIGEKIQARQRERLASIGPLVTQIAGLFDDVLADERALADLRGQLRELGGQYERNAASMIRPVCDPFPTSAGSLVALAYAASAKDYARGRPGYGEPATFPPALLETVPDLRVADGEELATVEGTQMFHDTPRPVAPKPAPSNTGWSSW